MKYYIGGTVVIVVMIGMFTKSWLLNPSQEFYGYVLPFFYDSPYYKAHTQREAIKARMG